MFCFLLETSYLPIRDIRKIFILIIRKYTASMKTVIIRVHMAVFYYKYLMRECVFTL